MAILAVDTAPGAAALAPVIVASCVRESGFLRRSHQEIAGTLSADTTVDAQGPERVHRSIGNCVTALDDQARLATLRVPRRGHMLPTWRMPG
jgi:hypothetical protein